MAVDRLTSLARRSAVATSLDSHHYITHSLMNVWMERVARPNAAGVLLDYGCGGQPYRRFMRDSISRYIGADVTAAEGIELDMVIEPGKPLDLPDQSVDTVLSTQVLEHVRDFGFYLDECARLLRPGGALLMTVPMQWRLHESPFDYWRFTRFGIVGELDRRGFSVEDVATCGGVYALIGQILLSHLAETGRTRKRVFRFVNRLALWMDTKQPDSEDTLNWMLVARKQ